MIYRICEPYCLRGWKGLPMVLLDRQSHGIFILSRAAFEALILCDGESEIRNHMTEEMKNIISHFEQKHIICKVDHDQPVTEEQKYRYFENRYIRSVYWSITGKCNCKCRHCFVDAPNAKFGELSTAEAIDVIDQMAACGVSMVDLSGGEPFVRKDIWRLIDHMLECDISIGQVYTNGCLVNEYTLDQFDRRSLHPGFAVSFDGLGWHNWLRRKENAEYEALNAIRLLITHDYQVAVSMCVHQGNIGDLQKNIEYLANLGVPLVNVSGITSTPLWLKNCEGNILSNEQYYDAMLRYIPQYYNSKVKIQVNIGGVIEMYPEPVEGKRYSIPLGLTESEIDCKDCYICDVARWNCYITPEGRLVPCMPMTWHEEQNRFPLISEVGLCKGLSDSTYIGFTSQKVSDLIEKNEECRNCQYLKKCRGGCRANALNSGDLMGPDRERCFFFKNGYLERIREVAEEAVAKYCQEA